MFAINIHQLPHTYILRSTLNVSQYNHDRYYWLYLICARSKDAKTSARAWKHSRHAANKTLYRERTEYTHAKCLNIILSIRTSRPPKYFVPRSNSCSLVSYLQRIVRQTDRRNSASWSTSEYRAVPSHAAKITDGTRAAKHHEKIPADASWKTGPVQRVWSRWTVHKREEEKKKKKTTTIVNILEKRWGRSA